MPARPTVPADLVPDETEEAPEAPLNRRERRARAGGGPSAKVFGPQQGHPAAMPTRGRDYAHRRRG